MNRPVTAWPGYDVERTSVRVVLLDPEGRLLLFRTVDPRMPETGQWWELPGGGMEPGETPSATAVREVAEETGLVIAEADVSPPTWRRTATYARRHIRTLQHEVVVSVRVTVSAPEPAPDGRTPDELEEYVGHVWWTAAQVAAAGAAGERFFPGSLPALLGRFLTGEELDQPFERWN